MLRISFQTLRARRASLAGAFVAIWLAVTLAYATGLLMAGALGAPGPGRFAAADAVLRADLPSTLGHGDDAEQSTRPRPAAAGRGRGRAPPRCPASPCDRRRVVPRRRLAAGRRLARRGAERLHGHGWASAALTPYRLSAGHAPADPRDVVADARLGVRVGRTSGSPRRRRGHLRVAGSRGRANRDAGRRRCSSPPRAAARLSGAPGRVNAIGVIATPGSRRPRCAPGCRRTGPDVLDRARPPRPTRATRRPATARPVAIFGTMGGIAGVVALFVVAGTFALAIAQRRRETAVLRALGATPRQVRRLIAGEALFVSSVARRARGAGGRAARRRDRPRALDHGVVPAGFGPGTHGSRSPPRSAWASASPSSRSSPRRGAPGASVRPRRCARSRSSTRVPAVVQLLTGVLCLGGGVDDGVMFSGEAARPSRSSPASCWRPGPRCSAAVLLGLPAAAMLAARCGSGRPRAAREHEPGRQPLAHGSAGDPDRPDRDARRHTGGPPGELAAARRARDRGAGDRRPRRGRARRRAAAGRHRAAGWPACPASTRRGRAADERLPARQGPRLGHAVGGGGGRGARHRPRARPPRHERQPGRRARIGRRGERVAATRAT